MKALTTTLILIIYCGLHLAAQENRPGQPIKGVIVKGGKNPRGKISITANFGYSPSAGVSGAASFNPNIGLELMWGRFGIGADAGTFSSVTEMDFNKYIAPLQGKDPFAISNTRSKWTSTYVLAGPQYTFGKPSGVLSYTISVKGGITHVTAPEFSVNDNFAHKKVAAYAAPADEQKTIFTMKPGVSIAYGFTSRLSLQANVQYLFQPARKEAMIAYRDLSKVDFSGNAQEISAQVSNQPVVTQATKGPDKYLSAGIGISYTFKKGRANVANATAKDTRTYTAGRKNEGQPAAKSISTKGVSSTYQEDAAFLNSLFVENGTRKDLNPALFKQVTEDRELKGMKVYFKKDRKIYKYLGNQDRLVEILQSANRPAGCVDCTTRECNGVVYDCACVNGFCFCVLCVDITKLSELAD